MSTHRALFTLPVLLLAACGGLANYGTTGYGPDAGLPATTADGGGGSFGNVGVGGGQDFAAFRDALDHGLIPSPESLDATGFFAEHYTALPAPTCGDTFCLHAMLSVSPDLARGGTWTLLQLAMNSPIDPATVTRPPLDLVVVIDRSGSMADDQKLVYVKQGVDLLIDQLGEDDTLTVIAFSDTVETLFGPRRMGSSDRGLLKAKVDELSPEGSTDIYDALQTGYQAALATGDETQQRRVIFLTDGLPTAGYTDDGPIESMSAGYNERTIGLTTIGVGLDAGLPLLRTLAEQGAGNFYFLEKPEAITEVFTEELAFFVAPLAYDVDLWFDSGAPYDVAALYGTSLWRRTATGGQVHVPSVFLVSRTSTDPGPSGGRRGGGSAIVAELRPTSDALPGHTVARAHLRYRLPGSQTYRTQDVAVTYGDHPGVCGDAGFYSRPEIQKNTWILGFYVAFRDATALAANGDLASARRLLERFQERIEPRILDVPDDDLQDDLAILAQYLSVLSPASAS